VVASRDKKGNRGGRESERERERVGREREREGERGREREREGERARVRLRQRPLSELRGTRKETERFHFQWCLCVRAFHRC